MPAPFQDASSLKVKNKLYNASAVLFFTISLCCILDIVCDFWKQIIIYELTLMQKKKKGVTVQYSDQFHSCKVLTYLY